MNTFLFDSETLNQNQIVLHKKCFCNLQSQNTINYSFTTMWRYIHGYDKRSFPWYALHFPRPIFDVHVSHKHFHLFQDCVLYAVGKPVYFKSTEQNYGAWLRDPMARNDNTAERIWMTKENDGFQLFEYANKAAYRNNMASKVYRMQFPFKVNKRTFINASFVHSTFSFLFLSSGQCTRCLQRILLLLSKGWTEDCEIWLSDGQAGRWA